MTLHLHYKGLGQELEHRTEPDTQEPLVHSSLPYHHNSHHSIRRCRQEGRRLVLE